jgi:hypothetical protein
LKGFFAWATNSHSIDFDPFAARVYIMASDKRTHRRRAAPTQLASDRQAFRGNRVHAAVNIGQQSRGACLTLTFE